MKPQSSTLYFLAMVVAMLLWGVAWTAGKIAALHSNVEVAAFWRYAISFATMIPLVYYLSTSLRATRSGLGYTALAGLLTAVFNYLFFAGVTHGQAGYGGTMVTSIAPILTYALSLVFFSTKASPREFVALGIGIAGALVLMRVPMEGLGFMSPESGYFVAAALVWAMVTILSQKASGRIEPMFYTIIVFGMTAVINLLFALPYAPFDFARYDATFWWTIVFIGIFPGTLSTALFFVSASKLGAHKTGVFMFIVPIGAIVSSMIVYDERIELSTYLGAILAFGAVVMFNLGRKH